MEWLKPLAEAHALPHLSTCSRTAFCTEDPNKQASFITTSN
ncbi:hypothetical protein [Jeotgalibacillus marinus]|uniref:Uncharacterized protein n=1 Tax=Jeotgalibacillus marinus TaxID=86667 RepID=A0ABV3Q111_9BACL